MDTAKNRNTSTHKLFLTEDIFWQSTVLERSYPKGQVQPVIAPTRIIKRNQKFIFWKPCQSLHVIFRGIGSSNEITSDSTHNIIQRKFNFFESPETLSPLLHQYVYQAQTTLQFTHIKQKGSQADLKVPHAWDNYTLINSK